MPHHALVTQSEDGVSQRWCERAKWISRPVLVADWPGMTPYTAKPPVCGVADIAVGPQQASRPDFAEQNRHITLLFFSFRFYSVLTTYKMYATRAAFSRSVALRAERIQETISNGIRSGCVRDHSAITKARCGRRPRNDQDIVHRADLGRVESTDDESPRTLSSRVACARHFSTDKRCPLCQSSTKCFLTMVAFDASCPFKCFGGY
jgi:hypothetical protein